MSSESENISFKINRKTCSVGQGIEENRGNWSGDKAYDLLKRVGSDPNLLRLEKHPKEQKSE